MAAVADLAVQILEGFISKLQAAGAELPAQFAATAQTESDCGSAQSGKDVVEAAAIGVLQLITIMQVATWALSVRVK